MSAFRGLSVGLRAVDSDVDLGNIWVVKGGIIRILLLGELEVSIGFV